MSTKQIIGIVIALAVIVITAVAISLSRDNPVLIPTLDLKGETLNGSSLFGSTTVSGRTLHIFSATEAAEGIVLPANDHNIFTCALGGPLLSEIQLTDDSTRFWGYEYTGNEVQNKRDGKTGRQLFDGQFFISQGELTASPGMYDHLNELTTIAGTKTYYFMAEQDLFVQCDEGITVRSLHPSAGNGSSSSSASADTHLVHFYVTLDGEQAGTLSETTGTATFILDLDIRSLAYDISFEEFSSFETGKLLRGPSYGGEDAPVLFNLPTGNHLQGSVTLDNSEQVNDLLAGRWYLNIHSQEYQFGEIRGWIRQSVTSCEDFYTTNSVDHLDNRMGIALFQSPPFLPYNLVRTQFEFPSNITVDQVHEKIYWAEVRNGNVYLSRSGLLSGSPIEDLYNYQSLDWNTPLAVAPEHNFLFWVENGTTLRRATLDGVSNIVILPPVEDDYIQAIAIDSERERLYLATSNAIIFTDFNGENAEQFHESSTQSIAIDSSSGTVYWSFDAGIVRRIMKQEADGTGTATLLENGILVQPSHVPLALNEYAQTLHILIQAASSSSYEIWKMNTDGSGLIKTHTFPNSSPAIAISTLRCTEEPLPPSSSSSSVASSPPAGPVCGNGIVEEGEQCDDGNLIDGDGCFSNCTLMTPPHPLP